MKKGLGLLGVAGTTPLSEVCQRALALFDDHPTIEVRALIADDPADVGRSFGEVTVGRWLRPEPVPERWVDTPLAGIDDDLRTAGVDLVLSSLIGPRARELDPVVAALGLPVVSESMGLRLEPDVPLVVPEVNPEHIGLVEHQRSTRGWKGYIVASPLCTAVIAALVQKPLDIVFGVDSLVVTSLQALSGAGPSGVPAMASLDNVLPHIDGEEEKLSAELPKILGKVEGTAIRPHDAQIAATCTRVGVRHGHTLSMTFGLTSPATAGEVSEVLMSFRGSWPAGTASLRPDAPLTVESAAARPQPLLDRDRDGGRVVTVGRVREQATPANGIGLVAVGHNHERGTWGNAAMLCEHLVADGWA
ncbi:MAG: aspartate-semialdehyde dehydrogenase [Gaiella sp.]|nr:aspartate-semialdehyde dehydrogenase [Gaiella sp.]